MTRAGRALIVGVIAVLIGGCATTGSGGTAAGPEISPVSEGIPWSGADLQFFDRAVTVIDIERDSHTADVDGTIGPAPAPAPSARIELGPSASVQAVVFAASFTEWESGRQILVDADVLDERAAERLDRVVLRRQGASVAGYLDVDSRRLPAALSLHWSGWERRGLGTWREPTSRVQLWIPRNGGWVVSRGPAISASLRESVFAGAAGRLATAAAEEHSGPVEAPVIAWAQGPQVEGIPPQLLPSHLTVLVVPAETGDELLAHVALPFSTERDARVAMVVSRLVIPRFLQEIGLRRGPGFGIVRDGHELYVVNVTMEPDQLSDVLSQSAGFLSEGENQ